MPLVESILLPLTGQRRVWIWLNSSIQEHSKFSIEGIRALGSFGRLRPYSKASKFEYSKHPGFV